MNTHRTESFRRLGIVALVLLVTLCSWYSPITDRAESSVNAGLQRSLLSFASARALNGAISAVQGTEVSVQPLGVGMTLSVGEVLDPVNDLVESFSSVMLMSSVAFGIEKLLLALGSGPLISALVTALALAWVLRFVHDRPTAADAAPAGGCLPPLRHARHADRQRLCLPAFASGNL